MFQRAITCVAVMVMAAACTEPPGFAPPPESYSVSQAMIEGVSGERPIASVDSTFFGINQPLLGRLFSREEFIDAGPVAILSNAFWVEHFGERPDVIGSEVNVGGVVRRIVGIMARGVDVPQGAALWIPRE